VWPFGPSLHSIPVRSLARTFTHNPVMTVADDRRSFPLYWFECKKGLLNTNVIFIYPAKWSLVNPVFEGHDADSHMLVFVLNATDLYPVKIFF
jgi:hypothetical protein